MGEAKLSMIRARVWCSKISARALKAVPSLWIALTRIVTCSSTSGIKRLQFDSRALDEHSASVSGQLHRKGEKRLKKKPSMSILGRSCESVKVAVQPPQIKGTEPSDMQAAAIGGKTQGNTPVMSGSSLEESISAMESERLDIAGELSAGRLEAVSAVEDVCREFRNCVIEMIVEEKDFRDLMDVEEILFCYQNLTSPFYRELLSKFFVEICTDTFGTSSSSSSAENEELSCSSVL